LGSHPALDVRYGPAPDASLLQDLLHAELDPFEPLAIQEHEAADGWRVFFRQSAQRDGARAALDAAFGDRLLDLSPVDVDDEDWARRSQAALSAIEAGRITIAPPWGVPTARDPGSGVRDPRHIDPSIPGSADPDSADPGPRIPDPDRILIVIDPSMGFGTGHHATTRLCLGLLQELDVRGKRVVDAGTGSGILAIAAWMLGASSVTALDHDPDALQNARDNIERNGGAGTIEVLEADVSSGRVNPADIVLANLTGAVLRRHAAGLTRLAGSEGVLVVSGFSPDDVDGVVGAFSLANQMACGREIVPHRVVRDGDWAAAVIGPSTLRPFRAG
jgi:ribosomal protein L11 methylase PrmA